MNSLQTQVNDNETVRRITSIKPLNKKWPTENTDIEMKMKIIMATILNACRVACFGKNGPRLSLVEESWKVGRPCFCERRHLNSYYGFDTSVSTDVTDSPP